VYRSRAFAASCALAAGLAAIAFGAAGGTELEQTTIVEVAVVLVTGLLLALGTLHPGNGSRFHGGTALALLGVFTALTGLSMSWSIAPELSLQETARSLSYLGLFAAALVAARLAPSITPAVLGGVLGAAVAVAGWALATRIWPGALADNVIVARLSDPLGYWNALGAIAATAVPAALWLGSRREGSLLGRALAYPALGVLLLTILLTQSRGALATAIVVTLVWLAAVPLRLRSIPVILVPALSVAPVGAWALSKDAFTETLAAPAVRESVAASFGLLCLAMVLTLVAAGGAIGAVAERRAPSLALRRRAGLALVAITCLAPLALVTSVAASDRGIGGTISDRFNGLTDEKAPPRGAGRLSSVSSSRGPLWRQAGDIFDEQPLLGTGAGTFGLARLRYREEPGGSRHAHGFVAQTLADLGAVGVAVALALLAAWLAAAALATGLLPRGRPRPPWSGERVAVCALALCAVAFGLQSLIDWTWFVPGSAAPALVAAGFVAGRGPLRRLGERSVPNGGHEPGRLAGLLPAGGVPPARALTAGAVIVTTLLCAWATWQPERAARANESALRLVDRGDIGHAVGEAERAREIDPYSPEPLYAMAALHAEQGRLREAYRALEHAVIEHPRDPEPWLRLASFELERLRLFQRALETSEAALRVDRFSHQAAVLRDRARRALGDPAL
jgi:tetratricopeptide (TPR) repeat protein